MTAAVKHPGSRGGAYWIDKQGTIRYGPQPAATPPPPQQSPVAPQAPPAVPTAHLATPGYAEFGAWSPEARRLHLRGALFYADSIARICRRFRELADAGQPVQTAARRACRGLDADEHLRLVRGCSRIGRLRAWDDAGTKQGGDPEGSGIPAPATKLSPFVLGALAEGVPLATARQLAAIVARAPGTLPEGENQAHADLAGALLDRPDADAGAPVVAPDAPEPLEKAVLKPGSRGGHVYWWHGKLRYGTPPIWHPRTKGVGSADIKPTWQAPGRLARRILATGHRVLFLASDDTKQWGQVIAASGELLSVLPDNAQVYDLLHTVVVPAERVLRVLPDTEGMGRDEPQDEPDADAGERPLRKAAPGESGGAGPGWPAADCSPWPDERAEAALEGAPAHAGAGA